MTKSEVKTPLKLILGILNGVLKLENDLTKVQEGMMYRIEKKWIGQCSNLTDAHYKFSCCLPNDLGSYRGGL